MGTQAGWLLPIAAIGAVANLIATRLRPSPRLAVLIIFGGWAASSGYVISITKGLTHPYYLAVLAPPVAVLFCMAVGLWFDASLARRRAALLGPVALLATAFTQWTLLRRFPPWRPWTAPFCVASLVGGAALALLAGRTGRPGSHEGAGQWTAEASGPSRASGWMRLSALAMGVASVLFAPALWLQGSIANGMNAALPYAVPFSDQGGGPAEQQPGGIVPNGGFQFPDADLAGLAAFLRSQRTRSSAIPDVIVPSAAAAEGLIIRFGIAAVPVGGFVGSDPIITAEVLQARVAAKTARFFLLPASGGLGDGFGGGFGGQANLSGPSGAALGGLLPGTPRDFGSAPTTPGRTSGRSRGFGGQRFGFGGTSATAFVSQSCAVVNPTTWSTTGPVGFSSAASVPIQTFRGGPSAAPFTLYDCEDSAAKAVSPEP